MNNIMLYVGQVIIFALTGYAGGRMGVLLALKDVKRREGWIRRGYNDAAGS